MAILHQVNDEWRIQVDVGGPQHAMAFSSHLAAGMLKHELSREFRDRVIVSVDGARVFLYAGTRDQAERARIAIEQDAQARGWALAISFRRWHPIAEEWMGANAPFPNNENARRNEREQLMQRERAETKQRGYPEFEVRVELTSHRDALALVKRLCEEEIPVVHRWRYLLVGAADEDSASDLADLIRRQAPDDAVVSVEGTWAAVGGACRPSAFSVWRTTQTSHPARSKESRS